MFSQKKSFLKEKMFFLLIVGLLVGGYWMNKGGESASKQEVQPGVELSTQRETTIPSHQADKQQPAELPPGKPEEKGQSVPPDSLNDTSSALAPSTEKPYYLVRNDDGIIKIYYCEDEKSDQFIRATDINYSLLRESDQNMFDKGVIRKTKDGLSELLQDFES